ncbi:MAG: fused response regulator/thioredoxin-disulfide reductase [Actinomycetia bacterium]|jgi:thioredoxin reductase (NADPH)|nr:fused response regulator/thioredoxin-disulfide reductase [Actinomycetes bacterium]
MPEPVILVVADDGRMLDALAGDLLRRFGGDYRILAERSPTEAVTVLERLADPVALVIAARRMEGMDGLALLVRAHELHPLAKRVLLEHRGEWASGEPVVRAMTLGQLDYLLFRPWLPLEQFLYLPVSEFLAAWEKSRAPSTEAIQIVGRRWDPRSHELRETLARVAIPYGFYPDDSPEGRRLLEQAGQDGSRLPVVLFRRGLALVDPTHAELSAALGMRTHPVAGGCDVLIVGAGPAGLAAAVYAASEGYEAQVLEPAVPGGQAGTSSQIRNYLGFPYGLSGDELTMRAVQQAWLFGADLILAQAATGLRADGHQRVVRLSDGTEVVTRAVILATGVAWRRLGVPALEALNGSGVFYGAAGSEARAMRGEHVFVVGAGNSAGQAAVHLSTYAASVTIVTIDERLGEFMSDYLVQKVQATPNVTVVLHTEVVDGHGRQRLEGLTLRDRHTGATRTVAASAVFVLIGAEPRTDWLDGVVERDERGYVLTGRDLLRDGRLPPSWPLERPPLLLETSLPGVFAAGDVRYRSVKRVASAVGEGSIAVQLIHEYLAEPGGPGG